jgi:hypothetical protein
VAASTDVAADLLTFAGGPSIVSVAILLRYARCVLNGSDRTPAKGWLALGAGVLLCGWMLLFLGLACPTVWRSWFAGGSVEPKLVLLSAAWFAAIGLLAVCLWKARAVGRYLSESYHKGEGPWLLRMLRRLID